MPVGVLVKGGVYLGLNPVREVGRGLSMHCLVLLFNLGLNIGAWVK